MNLAKDAPPHEGEKLTPFLSVLKRVEGGARIRSPGEPWSLMNERAEPVGLMQLLRSLVAVALQNEWGIRAHLSALLHQGERIGKLEREIEALKAGGGSSGGFENTINWGHSAQPAEVTRAIEAAHENIVARFPKVLGALHESEKRDAAEAPKKERGRPDVTLPHDGFRNRVEALADAWASMDGKVGSYRLGANYNAYEQQHGYNTDAAELIKRLEARGWKVTKS